MAHEEEAAVVIREFKGQVSYRNPHNLAPGEMVKQVNCYDGRPGELVIRGGLRQQTSDTET